MKQNYKLIGLVASLVFAVGVVFAFFWVWGQLNAKDTGTQATTAASNYVQVEISSVKKEAEDILRDKQKYGSIPVKAPAETGRDNPFADL